MFQQGINMGPGTGSFTSHTFEIFIMLLGAFLIGLWLGWVLWSKFRQIADRMRLENEALQTSVKAINDELGTYKGRFATLDNERADLTARLTISDNENADLRSRIAALQADMTELATQNRQLETEIDLNDGEDLTLAALATQERETPVVTETPVEPTDDITISVPEPSAKITIEFNAPSSTVTTETPADDILPEIEAPLEVPVSRDVQMPPAIDDHDHFSDIAFESLTRNMEAPENTASEAEEKPASKKSKTPVLTALQQDDLKIVEGIGPKIEQLLFNAGIHTYSELAAAPVSRLKEILDEAGSRFKMHDPGTWSAQALLAANGEWENLKAYQEFLDAGKRPDAK